jgi:hypothetical protein
MARVVGRRSYGDATGTRAETRRRLELHAFRFCGPNDSPSAGSFRRLPIETSWCDHRESNPALLGHVQPCAPLHSGHCKQESGIRAWTPGRAAAPRIRRSDEHALARASPSGGIRTRVGLLPKQVVSIDPHSENRRRGPGGTRTLTSRVSTERSTFELPDRLSRHTPQTRHRASSGIRTRTPGFGRPGPYRWTMLAIPDAPALLAWSSRRAEWSRSRESNPSSPSYQEGVVPRRPERQELEVAYCLAATGGLEPPSHRLTGGRSSIELRRKNWMKQKEAGRGERVA